MTSGEFRQTDNGLVFNPWAGSDITDCIQHALKRAKRDKTNVTILNFNGIDVTVTPTSDPDAVYAVWRGELDRRADEYRNSPEGRRSAQEAEERKQHCQREVDRLLANVPQELDQLVPWLAEFSDVGDHVGVVYDQDALIATLLSYGYAPNAHVTKDKKAVKHWTKQQHGEYIVGQALSCLQHGMPPHPITQNFAEEYLAMA